MKTPSLLTIGLRKLRLYLTLIAALTGGNIESIHAQIDVAIDIIEGFAPSQSSNEDKIRINPNPIVQTASVEHETGLVLKEMQILNENGNPLFVIDLEGNTSFTVSLSPGYYYWVFYTSQGTLSKRVFISDE